MEIKLNAGDKINIPTGCKATIKDNLIVIEEKQEEFKDGDILHSTETGKMVIFKEYDHGNVIFCSYYNTSNCDNFNWGGRYFRHATEEEKQEFFDERKAKGLKWNAKTKTMERIRERARKGEKYLTVNSLGHVREVTEEYCIFNDTNFNLGNYYLLSEREQAEKDAAKVRAIFQERLNKSK